MNKLLALALYLVAEAYKDEYDKGGNPMMLHFIYVMNNCGDDLETKIIAVLHDAAEDGKITLNYLREMNFPESICTALDILWHKEDEDYLNVYIKRIALHTKCKAVKKADLKHNSDITRLKGVRQKDFERLEKYSKAYLYLS